MGWPLRVRGAAHCSLAVSLLLLLQAPLLLLLRSPLLPLPPVLPAPLPLLPGAAVGVALRLSWHMQLL